MCSGIRPGQVGKKKLILVIASIVVAGLTIAAVLVLVGSERGVDLSVHTEKKAYAPGEPVLIHAKLTNYGFKEVELVYGNSIVVMFTICDSDGFMVFNWPKYALEVITHVTLEPGETRDYEYSWNQLNESGEQAELPDTFTVHALSWSFSHQFRADATFSISD